MNKNLKYGLLFILFLLTSLGIWKCPKFSDKTSKVEFTPEKHSSSEVESIVQPDTILKINETPKAKPEKTIPQKEDQPISLKSTEESTPREQGIKDQQELPVKEKEITPEKEVTNPKEEFSKKAIKSFQVDKNIDKRLSATSNISCTATTIFKLNTSTFHTSVAFSPDGTTFATGNNDNYASVMNMEGKEIFKLTGHDNYVSPIKYSSDGKFIVTGSVDHTAKLWDAKNGQLIKSFVGHADGILSVDYSNNGHYIATGSLDNTTIIWDATSGKKLFQLRGHESEIAGVAFSRDSRLLITGSSDGTAKLWDVKSGKILYALEGLNKVVSGVAFTPDDKIIITGSGKKIRLWNAKTGKHLHTINGLKSGIMSIDISNDGAYIVSASINGLINVWAIKGGKEICQLEGHTNRTREAVFHPIEKNIIVSVSLDKTIRMWKFE